MKRSSESGFSLIELMVVVSIMAILAVVVISRFTGVTDDARVQKAKFQINEYANALEMYKLKFNKYPSTSEGLSVLDSENTKSTGWSVDLVPDPWGNDYKYEYDSINNRFDIICYGADGAPGGTGFNADIKYSERREWDKPQQ